MLKVHTFFFVACGIFLFPYVAKTGDVGVNNIIENVSSLERAKEEKANKLYVVVSESTGCRTCIDVTLSFVIEYVNCRNDYMLNLVGKKEVMKNIAGKLKRYGYSVKVYASKMNGLKQRDKLIISIDKNGNRKYFIYNNQNAEEYKAFHYRPIDNFIHC